MIMNILYNATNLEPYCSADYFFRVAFQLHTSPRSCGIAGNRNTQYKFYPLQLLNGAQVENY